MEFKIDYGVLQGLVSGPLLVTKYYIYINDIVRFFVCNM